MNTSTISNNANGEIQVENEDLEALMSLAINAIDNRLVLNDGKVVTKYDHGDASNYIRWRKLALRIADVVE